MLREPSIHNEPFELGRPRHAPSVARSSRNSQATDSDREPKAPPRCPPFMQYASPVLGIVACPFCREMFDETEATACPVCGMNLAPLAHLPPSHDAIAEEPFL